MRDHDSANTAPSRAVNWLEGLGLLIGRSLFPITAVVILGGTFLWGPWITLGLALGWFGLVNIVG